jgi:hypothetical protein
MERPLAYLGRFLDRSLSVFVLSNNPAIEPIDVGNMATAAFG